MACGRQVKSFFAYACSRSVALSAGHSEMMSNSAPDLGLRLGGGGVVVRGRNEGLKLLCGGLGWCTIILERLESRRRCRKSRHTAWYSPSHFPIRSKGKGLVGNLVMADSRASIVVVVGIVCDAGRRLKILGQNANVMEACESALRPWDFGPGRRRKSWRCRIVGWGWKARRAHANVCLIGGDPVAT